MKYFAHRDENNNVVGISRYREDESQDIVDNSDADVIAYLNPPEPTNEEIYDLTLKNSKVIKALALSLNDGSFVPGSNLSGAALKKIITDRMKTFE